MTEAITLLEALYTTRAQRRFLARPVPRDLIMCAIDAAIRAPSAINTQPWRFIVVTDGGVKDRIGAFYRDLWQRMFGDRPVSTPIGKRASDDGTHLLQNFGDVPAIVVVCGLGPIVDTCASVYPAVQNFLLATRALGLGSVLTRIHRYAEDDLKQILGVPEEACIAAVLPVGYPERRFGPVRRKPAEEVTSFDHW